MRWAKRSRIDRRSPIILPLRHRCHGGFVSDAYRAGKILAAAGVVAGGDMTNEAVRKHPIPVSVRLWIVYVHGGEG